MAFTTARLAPPAARPSPTWDSTFRNAFESAEIGYFDWDLARPGDLTNGGGLRSVSPIETAIWLCLFTDARAPDELTEFEADRRGWWGDALRFGENEQPLGSLLWTLERATLNEPATLNKAKAYALEALQPLIRQRVVRDFTVEARAEPARNMLIVTITAVDFSGTIVFDKDIPV